MNYHYVRQAQYKKGFIAPLLLILVAIFLVGGGAYVYLQKTANQPTTATSTAQISDSQIADWKTYTNYAFGFSIKIPSNNTVYTCERSSTKPEVADEKSYAIFILENLSDITLIKSCDYAVRTKYMQLTINASNATPGAYSDVVNNWKKGYADGKYATVVETIVAGYNALIKTKVESPDNSNPYKEIIIDGGNYLYVLGLDTKSDSLEKILTTFQIIAAKNSFSDWQTLRSSDLGIEIKFPYSYRSNTVDSKLVAAPGLTIYPVPQPIEFGPSLSISRKSVPVDTNIDMYVNNFSQNMSVKERGFTTINGINWLKVRYEVPNDAGPGGTNVGYFAIHNGYVYSITYGESYAIYIDDFEKIVGTIKFTP